MSRYEHGHFPVDSAQWSDWRWQQQNAIRNEVSLCDALGLNDETLIQNIRTHLASRKIQVTPYYIDLIKKHAHNENIIDSPLLRQVIPFWPDETLDSYDGVTENWELAHEMKTPICQHKYENRVILRITNTCNAYCQFCFEALRTLTSTTRKANAKTESFSATLQYIKNTPSIEEVVLSGGDPLMLTDEKFDGYLSAIRGINDKLLIRIHSRALTFNPFRVTEKLIQSLETHRVTAFGIHVCHPWELSDACIDALSKLRRAVPILFANIPFLKSVNNNEPTLRRLFLELYRAGVKPYYLYHFMPFSPGSEVYHTRIDEALHIMNSLKRRISNIALPEYVIPHMTGKFTVPLLDSRYDPPSYVIRDGKRYYSFTNWQGQKCEWADGIAQGGQTDES